MRNLSYSNDTIYKFRLLPLTSNYNLGNKIIINVPYFDPELVKKSMNENNKLISDPKKVQIVNNIIKSVELSDPIYKEQSDYICDNSCNICIKNLGAELFRKIYHPNDYKNKYVGIISSSSQVKNYSFNFNSNKPTKTPINFFEKIDEINYDIIKSNNQIISVNWNNFNLDSILFHNPTLDSNEVKSINKMLQLYSTHKDKDIYKIQTDLICDEQNRICICNEDAYKFRQIYQGKNYDKTTKYINWIK